MPAALHAKCGWKPKSRCHFWAPVTASRATRKLLLVPTKIVPYHVTGVENIDPGRPEYVCGCQRHRRLTPATSDAWIPASTAWEWCSGPPRYAVQSHPATASTATIASATTRHLPPTVEKGTRRTRTSGPSERCIQPGLRPNAPVRQDRSVDAPAEWVGRIIRAHIVRYALER